MLIVRVIVFISMLLGSIGQLEANDGLASARAKVKGSLVLLTATALAKPSSASLSRASSGADQLLDVQGVGGEERTNYTTGFIVSEDGIAITNFHLIGALGDVYPDSLSIKAKYADDDEVASPVLDAAINNDLLIVKLQRRKDHGAKYTPVTLANMYSFDTDKRIYSSGYAKNAPGDKMSIIESDGAITAKEGPQGYLWTTSLAMESGQSGSPVYDETGAVIGVVKGDKGTLKYIIPIEFADNLLSYIRFKQIRDSMQDLRSKFTWRVNKTGRSIEISYEALMSGGPAVDEISVQAHGVGKKRDELEAQKTEKLYDQVVKPVARSGAEPVFEIAEIIPEIENYIKKYDYTSIDTLKLKITPIFKGQKLGRIAYETLNLKESDK